MSPEQEQKLVNDVAAIHRAVIGEEQTGHVGLVKRVCDLEAWKSSVMLKVAGICGACVAIGAIAKLIFTGKL